MSFFKDFKEDLSQAVNELVPGEDATEAADSAVVTPVQMQVCIRR